jgi:hypothetical protein
MKDIIRKIKFSRLKPEERFLINILSNLTEYKNDDVLIEYELISKNIFISYFNIRLILETKFNIPSFKINKIITEYLKNYLNITDIKRIAYMNFLKEDKDWGH